MDKPVSSYFNSGAQLSIVYPCVQGGAWGGCVPSEAGKFCILETKSCNLVNIFRCKFNKTMKTKFQFLRAPPTQIAHYGRTLLGAQMITWAIALVKHCREYFPHPSTPMILHISALLETNVKFTWACASVGILTVRPNDRPAEGPGPDARENFEI